MRTESDWLTKQQTMVLLGVSYKTLWEWTKSHPAFKNRGIKIRHVQNGRGRPSPQFWRRDVEAVLKRRSRESGWGLPEDEAADFVGASVRALPKWADRGCPALNGRKLRKRYEHRLGDDGRSRRVVVYNLVDLKKIRDWEQCEESDLISLDDAVEEFGWTRARIWKWTKKCPWLGRKLRSKLVRVKGDNGQIRQQKFVSHSDLEKVLEKLDADPPSSAAWMTREEAHDHFGFTESSIYHWGGNPCPWMDGRSIRTKTVHRKCGTKRAREVILYRVEDLQAIKDRQTTLAASTDVQSPDELSISEGAKEFGVHWAPLNLAVKSKASESGRTIRRKLRNGPRDKTVYPRSVFQSIIAGETSPTVNGVPNGTTADPRNSATSTRNGEPPKSNVDVPKSTKRTYETPKRELHEQWKAAKDAGESYRRIAKQAGVTKQAVINALKRLQEG